jgi:hypothetical protein
MATTATKQQVAAYIELVRAVAEAIKELKEVPSGHLYARLMHVIDLEMYTNIINLLKREKLVEERNYVLYWVG